MNNIPEEYQEEYEERAGIMEFSGNMPREKAEAEAVKLIRGKHDLYEQGEMF